MTSALPPPEPDASMGAGEFIAALQTLRHWSGLTYRQLAAKARASGGSLPPSTIASMLGRNTLPRTAVVVTFVSACGLDEETVQRWANVRDAIAMGSGQPRPTPPASADVPTPQRDEPAPTEDESELRTHGVTPQMDAAPLPADTATLEADAAPPQIGVVTPPTDAASPPADAATPPPAGWSAPRTDEPMSVPEAVGRRRALRWPVVVATALVLVLGVALVGFSDRIFDRISGTAPDAGGSPTEGLPAGSGSPAVAGLPADGWYLIRPAHIPDRSLCLGEGRERNQRTDRPLAVQRPCDSVVPDTYLAATTINGVYEIRWHHPREGVGCLTVDEVLQVPGALLGPADCTGAPHQRYLLEPTGTPVPNGYRLRPTHSGLCVGILYGAADVEIGAEAVQDNCTGGADQEFLLEATTRAFRL
jgi:hypothetical protein